MNDNISKRDWETISAYLDGQLSVSKQARLETRLQQDIQLRQAFEALQETRQVLRHTPRLRAPRNFLLTPEMVGEPRRILNFAPIFGWASAVTGLFLLLVLIGDIFSVGGVIPVAVSDNLPQTAQSAPDEVGMAPAAGGEVFAEAAEMETVLDEPLEQPVAVEPPTDEGQMKAAAAADEADATALDEADPALAPDPEVVQVEVVAVTQTPVEERDASAAADNTAIVLGAPSETDQLAVDATDAPEDDIEYVEGGILTDIDTPVITPTPTDAATEIAENSVMLPAEPPPDDMAAEKALPPAPQQPEPTALDPALFDDASTATETASTEEHLSEKQPDVLLGVEALLVLLVVSLGIAWLYLRRQGG